MAVSEYVASERRRAAVTKQKVTRSREEAVGSEQLILGGEQQLFLPYNSFFFCSY
jgi:hypothetical protein